MTNGLPKNITPTRIALAMWRVAGAVDDARKLGINLAVTIDVQGELESLRPLGNLKAEDLARAFRRVQERQQGIADGSVEDLNIMAHHEKRLPVVRLRKSERRYTGANLLQKPKRRPMSKKGRASLRAKVTARWAAAKKAGRNRL